MVDIIDEGGNVIGTVTRGELREKNLRYRIVVFIIINSKGEMLITKRSMKREIEPELYELPAGTVKSGETYEDAAKREVYEEVGIKDITLEFLFDLPFKDEVKNQNMRVFKVLYDGIINLNDGEVASYDFFRPKEVINLIKNNPEKFCKNRVKVLEKYLGEKIN